MRLSRTLLICIALLTLMSQSISSAKKKKTSKKKDTQKECETCSGIASAFHEGIKRTTKSNFGGGNTAWEERALGSYANSETRFVEISETVCEKSKHECHKMFEEHEELLESWWMEHREENEDLHQWFCIDEIKVCCPKNTYGPECKECPGGIDRPCMGNGKCVGEGTRGGSGKCKCDDGYKGALCDGCKDGYFEDVKNSTHVICLECHKACAHTCWGGSVKDCDECKEGWRESEDEGCEDIDECTEDNPCEAKQYCVNSEGSHSCKDCDYSCESCLGDGPDKCIKCRTGYKMEEGKCEDINECEEEDIQCDGHMTCYNDPGSYHCGCKEGYKRFQGECVDEEILKQMKELSHQEEEEESTTDNDEETKAGDDVVEGVVSSDGINENGGSDSNGGGRDGDAEGTANLHDKNIDSEATPNVSSESQKDHHQNDNIQQNAHIDESHKEL
ncbi:cysteine-rich with EGF-like domain protein 2 isoform X2 [Ptychodera flava]|uniref:cysteine-rich with EGF-like domain protein 2 isoform X2 n=1 Tax=Ptychodera flava TaxID=63121 RepID=UPI00396AAAE1